jgi:arylsulfatase A-like enzyme
MKPGPQAVVYRCSAAAALAGALFTATSCGPRYVTSPPQQISGVMLPESSVTRYVVLLSIDGLRPDAIGSFEAPTLQRLVREGSYSLAASTILPSKTLPSHTSMLTGEPPDRHGVLWNTVATAAADTIEMPNIFSVARSRGYRTAAFFSKSKFHALQRPGTLDYSQAPGGWFGRWASDRTVRDVEVHLDAARPNVLFVHLTDPDHAGHQSGWMSAAYGRGVTAADSAVARILTAADRAYGAGKYSLIVTADHGGHGSDHGTDDPRDVTIPWIAWGRGVKTGQLADFSIRTMDTASTVLWLLGLTEPSDWIGTPVFGAFQAQTAGDASVPTAQ